MKMMIAVLGTVVVCASWLTACKKPDRGDRDHSPPPKTTMAADELLAAPSMIRVDGFPVTLTSHVGRNRMPGPGPPAHERPLITRIILSAADCGKFPVGVDAKRFWLVQNDSVAWEGMFQGAGAPVQPFEFGRICWEGPQWSEGIRVFVVVEVIDSAGKTQLVGNWTTVTSAV